MNKQGPILAAVALVVGALAYYFWSKSRAASIAKAQPSSSSAGPGAASLVPTTARITPISGAVAPASLENQLAQQGINLGGSLLQQLTKSLFGTSTSSSGSKSPISFGGGGSSFGSGSSRSSTPATVSLTGAAPTASSNFNPNQPGYWTDPATGITYDIWSGEQVGGLYDTSGVGSVFDTGTDQGLENEINYWQDQANSIDLSGSGFSNDPGEL